MNVFSKHLNAIVTSKEINVSQMASFCKIDRSSMYKIIHGTRKPPSESLVELISLYLKLTPEESDLLMEKYRILQVGEVTYNRRKAALDFLKKCFSEYLPFIPSQYLAVPFQSCDTKKDTEVLSGKSSILAAFNYIIQTEQKNPDACLYIRMQPDQQWLDIVRTLSVYDVNGENRHIHIQHIIALDEKKALLDSDLFNMNILGSLIPTLMSTPNYELLYYYTNLYTDSNAFSFLPCAVITRDFVLQISSSLEFGLLHRQPGTISFFKKVFLDIHAGSIPLTVEIRDFRDLLYCGFQRRKGNSFVSFQMGFCMSYFITREILEKYVKKELPNRGFIIKSASEITQKDKQFLDDSYALILISEHGIREFMETGLLPEYPSELYNPIQFQDRLLFLKKYIDMIRDNPLCTIRLVRDSFGNLSSYNQVWLDERSALIVLHDKTRIGRIMIIPDSGILSLLRDFFQNIPENVFESPAESLNKMQEIYMEYSYQTSSTSSIVLTEDSSEENAALSVGSF